MKMRRHSVIRIALLLGLLLPLQACVVKNGDQGAPVDLRFEVDSRAGTEQGSQAENKITSIRLMVFNSSGSLDIQELKTDPSGFTSVPVEIDVTVMSGHKTFCAIANEPDGTTALLDAVSKLSDLTAISFGDHTTYNDGSGSPLPMTAMKTEYISQERDASDPLQLILKRAVGKVRMNIIKEPSNNFTTKLLSVQLKKTPTASRLMEGRPLTGGDLTLADFAAETSFSPDIITNSTPIKMTPLYLYELYWGKGTPEAAITGGATSLVVVISAEKTAGTWTNETYEFPLIGSVDNGEYVYEVRRNTIADFALIVAGEGIYLTYEVMEWEEDEYEKVPGEDDGNTKVEDWVLPSTVEYERELQ